MGKFIHNNLSSINVSRISSSALSKEETNRYREEFYSSEKNRLAQNVVSKTDPLEACLNRLTIDASNHVFSHKVKTKSFMGNNANICVSGLFQGG